MRISRILGAWLLTGLFLVEPGSTAVRAQEAAAPAEPEASVSVKSPPKAPRPKPLAKPLAKPPAKPKAAKAVPSSVPASPMALAPSPEPPSLTVLCEGRPARYAAETGVAIWVVRSGLVTVENPLRPLTPETTRVLDVVVGDRGATAYGPDLAGLRRGGTPAALEAALGSPIRWDAALTLLPDSLVIVSEANEVLARLPFRECSDAPAVKAPPVSAKPAKQKAAQARTRGPAGTDPDALQEGRAKALPKGLTLPQGAIADPEKGLR